MHAQECLDAPVPAKVWNQSVDLICAHHNQRKVIVGVWVEMFNHLNGRSSADTVIFVQKQDRPALQLGQTATPRNKRDSLTDSSKPRGKKAAKHTCTDDGNPHQLTPQSLVMRPALSRMTAFNAAL